MHPGHAPSDADQENDDWHSADEENDDASGRYNGSSVVLRSVRSRSKDDEASSAEDDRDAGAATKLKPKRMPPKWFMKCPRCWAILLGVILPLWLLIAISFFFGYGLAVLEAPSELDRNDKILKNKAIQLTEAAVISTVTQKIPIVCLEHYLTNRSIMDIASDYVFTLLADKVDTNGTMSMNFAFDSSQQTIFNVSAFLQEHPHLLESPLNVQKIFGMLENCTTTWGTYIRDMIGLSTTSNSIIMATGDLTFIWNRCPLERSSYNESSLDTFLQDSVIFQGVSPAYLKSIMPTSQSHQYESFWRQDAAKIYFATIKDVDLSGMNASTAAEAKFAVFAQAIDQATGRWGCHRNTVASVWFWFTIMTTIGYGNQTPYTWQGCAMVLTVGFLNILLFGAVAASAGYVMTAVANDLAARKGIDIETRPWIACVFWAALLYLWMIAIALVYQQWKAIRLQDDVTLFEAFWFSYISTTTIGLGDYFIDPDVLVLPDLLTFPVMFLISFVFFGAFIAEVGNFLLKPFENDVPFVDVLKQTSILWNKGTGHSSKDVESVSAKSEGSDRCEADEALATETVSRTTATIATGIWQTES